MSLQEVGIMRSHLPNPSGRRRLAVLAALVVAAAAALTAPPPAPAQGDPATPAAWVPVDAKALLHLRVADLATNPVVDQLRAPLDGQPWRFFLQEWPRRLAVAPGDVESITWV